MLAFFRWFCRAELRDAIEGDLQELHAERLHQRSRRYADLCFVRDVLLLFRPGIIRSFGFSLSTNALTMFRSYLLTAWRAMIRQKTYSAIKVSGLALGVAASFLILLYVLDEISYDQHIPDNHRIYRVVGVLDYAGELHQDVWFPAPFATALKEDYPEIETVGRYNASELFGAGDGEIRRIDQTENAYEEGIAYADADLLDILQPVMVYGDRHQALRKPHSIVLTRSKAEKFFPNEDPIGKLMILNGDEKNPLTVGGVMEDFPGTTHFRYSFLVTMEGREFWPGEQTWWRASNYPTYIKLREGVDARELSRKMTHETIAKYFLPVMLEDGVPDAAEIMKHARLEFQPVTDIHLNAAVNDSLSHGDQRFLLIFSGIAIFIILIACINFINLSTARSANRAKEVGLRKVFGSFRLDLINQFLTESVLFSVLAFTLGLFIAWLALPYFNTVAAKSLAFPWSDWRLYAGLALAAGAVGVLAGLYPSFYLSAFRPAQVLKGAVSRGSKHAGMRGTLVVFQFATSIVLLVSTCVIYQQMNFILQANLGYDKDQVVILQGTNTLGDQVQVLKEELKKISGVSQVSISDYLPVRGTKRNGNGFWKDGQQKVERETPSQFWVVDEDYLSTLGINLVAGRNFQSDLASDSSAVIINQKMVDALGLKEPVGSWITNGTPRLVIGVVENFHFESMRENIQPLAMRLGTSASMISVKLQAGDAGGTLSAIGDVWKKLSPAQPVRYVFLDERFARMYDDVQRTGHIFIGFTVLAMVVACLGLFSLSAFMMEQRAKEISIRLVLGSSVPAIFGLLTQNFLKLVLIAFVLAVPIAWFLMTRWLEDFVFRVSLGWELFALAGVASMLIALLTVGYHALRAAHVRPADTLRSE
jgi:putative ABC transport system permease protein